jgi:prepilin-type N-terminal cleavage/methylation domain-containing protein
MNEKKSSEINGFTLVEIMVVVAIIGMLTVMAVPTLQKTRARSQDNAVRNNLRQFASAGAQYMLDEGLSVVGYIQIIGPSGHLHVLDQVAGEDYTVLTVGTDTTRLSVNVLGRTVFYDF